MSYMQISVRFGRESGMDGIVYPVCQILLNHLLNEILTFCTHI